MEIGHQFKHWNNDKKEAPKTNIRIWERKKNDSMFNFVSNEIICWEKIDVKGLKFTITMRILFLFFFFNFMCTFCFITIQIYSYNKLAFCLLNFFFHCNNFPWMFSFSFLRVLIDLFECFRFISLDCGHTLLNMTVHD